jgi:hypothetical protein
LQRSITWCDYFAPPSPEKPLRGEHTRELGKEARERINADINVDNPITPP